MYSWNYIKNKITKWGKIIGISYLVIILLKIVGLIPFISWWVILSPIWIPIVFLLTLVVLLAHVLKKNKLL